MIKMIKDFFAFRKREKIQNSAEPYFTMNALEMGDDGIKVEMDWNNAFIKDLRDKGYPGINDEQVIEGYMHLIFQRAYEKNRMDENLTQEGD
jgi:hypothetical protein